MDRFDLNNKVQMDHFHRTDQMDRFRLVSHLGQMAHSRRSRHLNQKDHFHLVVRWDHFDRSNMGHLVLKAHFHQMVRSHQ